MFRALVKSYKYPNLNDFHETPFIGSALIACLAMLPMFGMQELVQLIFGKSQIFNLSVTFFFNN
tara:strand:- start:1102 stop:1293 length:192 start_codon:yes stop_codon:yes gene_type:complete